MRVLGSRPDALARLQDAMRKMAFPTIDCHAHIYTRAMPLAADAWHRPTADATAGQFLDEMAGAGIGYGVLAAASLYGDNNDYSLAATRKHRNLRTTVIVSPDIGLNDLRRMRADGAVGIRLQLRNKPIPDLASSSYSSLLRHVAALGWHVELHDDLERLPPVIAALRRAGVPIVVDHYARPRCLSDLDGSNFRAVCGAIGDGGVWIKLSSGFRLESAALVRGAFARLLDAGGAERLLWGTDWPFAGFEGRLDYRQAVDEFATLIDPHLRDPIDASGLSFYFPEVSRGPSRR